MRRRLTRDATLVATALFACELGAQTPTAWQFEVVSVKRNLADDMLQLSPTLQPGGRVFAIPSPLIKRPGPGTLGGLEQLAAILAT